MKKNDLNREVMDYPYVFDQVFSVFKDPIFNYLFYMTKNRSDAEDIFQESFVKIHKALPALEQRGNIKPWVYTVAKNCFLDHYRRKRDVLREEIHEESDYDDSCPLKKLELNEKQNFLKKQVENLSPKLREVYLLRMHEDLSFKEIAVVLSEPMPRVLKRMQLAIQQLKVALKKWEGSYENV